MTSKNQSHKKKVAVLMGGPSDEHDISLESGGEVLKSLPKEKYEAEAFEISLEGKWPISPEEISRRFDVAFIAMHGSYGEDGTIQAILEELGLPYTGSRSSVSALGMNKFLSLRLFKAAGLDVPPTLYFTRDHWKRDREDIMKKIIHNLDKPWVLKPNASGSSIGVKIVNDKGGLEENLDFLFKEFKEVIIQKYIEGKEVTCGVLDYGTPDSAFPLLPTEIIPLNRKFFDYSAKYNPESHKYMTPAGMPSPYIKEIRKTALLAHKIIGARHFSRTDMIISKDKKIYVLEINTIPGLTSVSLVPEEARVYGFSFEKFLDMAVESALKDISSKKSKTKKVV